MTEADLPLRKAVRAMMINHRDEILLVQLDLSFTDWVGWVLPGGGIEPGEDAETALRRELREETGLAQPFVGPIVCYNRHISESISPGFGGQEEAIYLVPCHDFALEPTMTPEELRDEGIVDMRWFSADELRSTTESLAPRGLSDLVERVLEFGGSLDPVVIEIVEGQVQNEKWW